MRMVLRYGVCLFHPFRFPAFPSPSGRVAILPQVSLKEKFEAFPDLPSSGSLLERSGPFQPTIVHLPAPTQPEIM